MKRFDYKETAAACFCLFVTAYFLIKPYQATQAMLGGLALWINKVLPVLFSFAVISSIALNLKAAQNKTLNFPLKPLGLSSAGAACYVISLICASPLSIKTVCDMYTNERLSAQQAQHLLTLCATISPVFLFSTAGVFFFESKLCGALFVFADITGAYLSALIYRAFFPQSAALKIQGGKIKYNTPLSMNFSQLFTSSVKGALDTSLNVGAYMAFFNVLLSSLYEFGFLKKGSLPSALIALFSEITQGIAEISAFRITLPKLSALAVTAAIGFGGLSLCLQNISFITKTNLSVKRFVFFKLVQAITSFFSGVLLLFLFGKFF